MRGRFLLKISFVLMIFLYMYLVFLAEKHARVPCVTASVDDLHIEKTVS